jgi:hypothetical protein
LPRGLRDLGEHRAHAAALVEDVARIVAPGREPIEMPMVELDARRVAFRDEGTSISVWRAGFVLPVGGVISHAKTSSRRLQCESLARRRIRSPPKLAARRRQHRLDSM